MKNRFNIEVKPGYRVSYNTARGEVRTGIVLKLCQMSVYGWRVETSRGSCGIDDVIKSEPVKRFSIRIQYGRERNLTWELLFFNGNTQWRLRKAKKHLKDCETQKMTGKWFEDVWYFEIVEA